jgi:hypothetical protein
LRRYIKETDSGAKMKIVKFDHDNLNVHIAGFASASVCDDDKNATVPGTGVVTLNRGVIFAGRADGTSNPIPTVAVTFPVSARIACVAAAAGGRGASAAVTGSILSYEISDYLYLKDVAVTGSIAASPDSGGIVDLGMAFTGKVDLSRSVTGLAFQYGELDVAFKTRVTSALGGFLQAEFEEEMLGFGSFMIETGPKHKPDMRMFVKLSEGVTLPCAYGPEAPATGYVSADSMGMIRLAEVGRCRLTLSNPC